MRKLLAILLLPIALLAQGGGQPVVIPIQNASFEQIGPIYTSDECGSSTWNVPGWTFGAGTRVIQLADGNPCRLDLPHDGSIMAIAGVGTTFSQDLGVTPQAIQASTLGPGYFISGVYTLKFLVANYFAINQPGLLSPIGAGGYPGAYDVELSFGSEQLCESYGWDTGVFTEVTMVCLSPNYIVADTQGSHDLILTFTGNGNNTGVSWPSLFDGPVSLTFTPQ